MQPDPKEDSEIQPIDINDWMTTLGWATCLPKASMLVQLGEEIV